MTVGMNDLTRLSEEKIVGYRWINSKFPPIHLFDDVASTEEFEDLYEIQALTNPRLQNEIGNLNLLPTSEIPFGITGCHYAAAPFTHINPNGSRFSDGSFGLMYIGDTTETAQKEVEYHQGIYWTRIPGLHYDRFVFKELICTFGVKSGLDASAVTMLDDIYSPTDYTYSRKLGQAIKNSRAYAALRFNSIRRAGGICFALFTPKEVLEVIQAKHYEMIWDGKAITSVNILSTVRTAV